MPHLTTADGVSLYYEEVGRKHGDLACISV
jgi:hypothetical protein